MPPEQIVSIKEFLAAIAPAIDDLPASFNRRVEGVIHSLIIDDIPVFSDVKQSVTSSNRAALDPPFFSDVKHAASFQDPITDDTPVFSDVKHAVTIPDRVVGDSPAATAVQADALLHAAKRDARKDLWLTGVILYRVLTGTCPFSIKTPPKTHHHLSTLQRVRFSGSKPQLPDDLAAAVDSCLDKDRRK